MNKNIITVYYITNITTNVDNSGEYGDKFLKYILIDKPIYLLNIHEPITDLKLSNRKH